MKIEGRNAVIEALNSHTNIEKLLIQNGANLKDLVAIARDKNIKIQYLNKQAMDDQSETKKHQGVIAFASEYNYAEVEDILKLAKKRNEDLIVVILDKLEDPHNLGSVARVVECSGAHGIIIPKFRSVGVTESAIRASAGALSKVLVAKVNNINNTIDELKKKNIFIYALDMQGSSMYKTNFKGDIGIIIGNEGSGVSDLTKKKADGVVSIPMFGKLNSLNASVSTGIALYEIIRQRKGIN